MGLPPLPAWLTPRRDWRFMSPFEKAHANAYDAALKAMQDKDSDENQLLAESLLDDLHDIRALLADATPDAPDCDLGMRLKGLRQKHAERVARDEADKATETTNWENAA